MTYAQSSYTPGQCTWYVAGTNSWIPPGLGNAVSWLTNAPAKGLRTGKTPVPGAVAVLEPGTPGLNVSSDGHVMDVVSVKGDTVTVRDMNWNYKPFQVSTHSLAASSISGYIYPPGGIVPTTSVAASDLASTTPAPSSGGLTWADILGGFGPGGMIIGNNPSAVGPAVTGVFGGILGAILQPVVKGGEVLIGFVAVLAGMFILVKHSNAGNSVINVATQTAKTGAKLAML